MRWIKSISAMLGGLAGYIFGRLDGFIIALLIFVVIDYITGLIAAVINGEVNSEVGYKGLLKKIGIFCAVAIANVIDVYVLQDTAILRTATCCFYIANDGISIIENLARSGVPFPEVLKKKFEQLKGEENDSD